MHPIDRPRQVDRGRTGIPEQPAGLLERLERGIARELEDDAVGGGDADQRRAADREAADRGGHVLRGPKLEPALLPGERGLVDRPQRGAVEAERDDARGRGPGRGHQPMLSRAPGVCCSHRAGPRTALKGP